VANGRAYRLFSNRRAFTARKKPIVRAENGFNISTVVLVRPIRSEVNSSPVYGSLDGRVPGTSSEWSRTTEKPNVKYTTYQYPCSRIARNVSWIEYYEYCFRKRCFWSRDVQNIGQRPTRGHDKQRRARYNVQNEVELLDQLWLMLVDHASLAAAGTQNVGHTVSRGCRLYEVDIYPALRLNRVQKNI